MVILLIQGFMRIGRSGRQRTDDVAFQDHHVLFIDGQPVFHPVAIQFKTGAGEVLEGVDRCRIGPAAFLL